MQTMIELHVAPVASGEMRRNWSTVAPEFLPRASLDRSPGIYPNLAKSALTWTEVDQVWSNWDFVVRAWSTLFELGWPARASRARNAPGSHCWSMLE